MAEAAFAALPIFTLFDGTLRLYDHVLHTQTLQDDLSFLYIRMRVEKRRLAQLQAALATESTENRPERLIRDTLQHIERTLKSIDGLLVRHGPGSGEDGDGTERVSLSAPQGTQKTGSKLKKPFKMFSWLGHDRTRLNELLNKLQALNQDLAWLTTPEARTAMDYSLVASSIATQDPQELGEIQSANHDQYPEIAVAAELKIMAMQSQGDGDHTSSNNPVKRSRISVDSIVWSKYNLDRSALHAYRGNVSLGQVVENEKAYGHYGRDPSSPPVPVLVEWRPRFSTAHTHSEQEERLDRLVTTLHRMYECSQNSTPSSPHSARSVQFSLLECIGWIAASDSFDRLGLIFAYPVLATSPRPMNLRMRMERDRRERRTAPALGARFDLAYGLAKTIADLVSIGWVHKNLRSENIAFISEDLKTMVHFYLTGFTYARPEDILEDYSRPHDRDTAWLLYRPPRLGYDGRSEQETAPPGQDMARLTSRCDIYALGIILLELAMWYPVSSLKGNKSVEEFHKSGELDSLVKGLSYRVGDIYAGQVEKCLSVGSRAESGEDEHIVMAEVIRGLGLCKA